MDQHKRPLWMGGLIAPLAPFLVAVFLARPVLEAGYLFTSLGMLALIFIPASYAIMLFAGLPAVLALRKWNILSSVSVCAMASSTGATAYFLFAAVALWIIPLNDGDGATGPGNFQLIYGASMGLTAGILFCIASGVRIGLGRAGLAK